MKQIKLKIVWTLLSLFILTISVNAQFICQLGQRTKVFNNNANFEYSALAYHQNRNIFFIPSDDRFQGIRGYDANTGVTFNVGLEGSFNNYDFEGLTWLEQDYFVLVEEKENEIYFLQYVHSSNTNNRKFKVLSNHLTNIPFVENPNNPNDKDGLEGVAYNPHLKTLYLVSEMDYRLYSIPIILPQGVIKGNILTNKMSEVQLPFSSGACTSGIFHLGINVAANHPLSNNILVLSQELKKVYEFELVLDANDKLTNNSVVELNEFSLNGEPQPEGIVIVNNNMYIASELQNGGLSSYTIKSENDTCNDGNSATINDTYDENCICVGEIPCQTYDVDVEISYKNCKGIIEVISISSGAVPYQISWSNGDTSPKIENLSTGTYKLSITDANDCSFEADYSINLSTPIEAIETVINASTEDSNDGAINLAVSGGNPPYTYSWLYENRGFSIQEDIDKLLSGSYIVTIKDAKGCQKVKVINVEVDCVNDISIVSNLNVTTNIFEPLNRLYQSKENITTQSTTSNLPDVVINVDEVVDLKSAHIKLDAGFKVENGACLNATIDPCQ